MRGMKGKQYINVYTSSAPLELLLNALVVIIKMNEQAYITLCDENIDFFNYISFRETQIIVVFYQP